MPFAAHWVKFCWIAQESFFFISVYSVFFYPSPYLNTGRAWVICLYPPLSEKSPLNIPVQPGLPKAIYYLSPYLLPQGWGTSCFPILGRLSQTIVRPPVWCSCSCVSFCQRGLSSSSPIWCSPLSISFNQLHFPMALLITCHMFCWGSVSNHWTSSWEGVWILIATQSSYSAQHIVQTQLSDWMSNLELPKDNSS